MSYLVLGLGQFTFESTQIEYVQIEEFLFHRHEFHKYFKSAH